MQKYFEISTGSNPEYRHSSFFCSTTPLHAAKLAGLGLLLPFLATEAHAEKNTASVQQPALMLREVVITSAPQSSPLTVVTDPKAPHQPIPASDGADYLKTIPGFSVIRGGGTNGDPVFRGMFGSRLNIVTDGGVILGGCGGRMDNPSSYISPESYDRLTVIKGLQTVRWGPAGSAGTILFERGPQHFDRFTTRADGSILYGADGRFDTRIDATAGDRPGYVRFIGNKSMAQDYHDGDGNRIPSRWNKWNGDLFIGLTPDKDTVVELSGGTGDGEARYASRGMDGTQFRRESLPALMYMILGKGMDGTQFRRESLSGKFVRSNIGGILDKIEAQVYYNYADHIMDNFRLRNLKSAAKSGMGGSMHMSGMPMESEPNRRTLGGRFAITWNWDNVSLVTGLDTQANTHRTRNRQNIRLTPGWNKDATFGNYGIFGELTWSVTSSQRIIAGARVDRISVEDYRKASATQGHKRSDTLPSGFLRYERDLETIPLTTYIGIAHTDRFPDYWELFSAKTADSRYVNAFSGIKPEKTTQIDFGAQYSDEATSIWFSGYAGQIHNYILFDYSGKQSRATNTDAAVMGGELGVSRYLTHAWKADASLAYAWGRNTTDKEALPQIPPLETRLGMTYEQEKWRIGALWRLVMSQNRIARDKGNVVGKDFGRSAGFSIFSINGSYRIMDGLRITVGIDNLFNKQYTEHLNRDGNAGFGFPAHYQVREPGRTFWTRADFKF